MDRINRIKRGKERREYLHNTECPKDGFCNDGRKGCRETAPGKKRPTQQLLRAAEGIGFRAEKIVAIQRVMTAFNPYRCNLHDTNLARNLPIVFSTTK
jgi:hypothetical protein